MKIFDTIAAIATPVGTGGVAIIRISGDLAEECAEKIVFPKSGRRLSSLESHKLTLADVKRASDGADIDEVLVSVMRAPHSYTGETVVEINCHGGYLVATVILEELFISGARQAEAGEFTRRAFMNGKTDLLKAEATIDIINSNSALGHENAAKTLSGKLSQRVNKIREEAVEFGAHLSAILDYPDEIDEMPQQDMEKRIGEIKTAIDNLLGGYKKGRIMRDGVLTVIAGRPNVGKSSLLNAISRSERAIVADVPGTTRDTVTEYVNVKGIALKLIDTAGIRESDNSVEKIGIERAKESIENAELCLFVVDTAEGILNEDINIFENIKDKNVIVILNKTDKVDALDRGVYAEKLGIKEDDIILTATPKGGEPKGIDDLEEKIAQKLMSGTISKDDVFISSERQKDSLIKAQKSAENMILSIQNHMPADMLYVDLEDLISALGEVTGLTVQDEIIDKVFQNFCVGK